MSEEIPKKPGRFWNLAAAAAAEGAEAESAEGRLPRLLRCAMAPYNRRPHMRERLLGDIADLAPDLEALAAEWLDDPVENAAQLARALDAVAVASDLPVLRGLADCVRVLGISGAPEYHGDHLRVAAALAACAAESMPYAASDLCARIQTIVLGWSIVASGIAVSDDEGAIWVADREVGYRLASITRAAVSRDREEKAAELRQQAAQRAADPDGPSATPRERQSRPAAPGFLRVCDVSEEEVKSKKLKDVIAGHERVVGCDVPLAPAPDISAVRKQLAFEFPHASGPIDQMLGDLVGKLFVRLRPTILVGEPGCGKSRLARRLAELLGVGIWRSDASQGDGATIAGTARRWSTAEACHPFLAISRFGVGNPIVLVDEVEKAGTRTDNGRLWDSMLGLLESETAGRYPDPALQTTLNLSFVSYIATANSLGPLPAPLRDRFRVIRFPTPGVEHLAALIPPILADHALEAGLDARWVSPLTAGEYELVAGHWKGGSIRVLQRFVETVLLDRERTALRQ
jgi:ATP-dependent Lon protease